eukprot:scaffold108700_cov60-Phaeocystis_antarctica.AAC.1
MGGVMNSSEPSGRTKPACICRTGGAHASGHQREPDQGFVPCVCGSPGYAAHQREAEHRHRAYPVFAVDEMPFLSSFSRNLLEKALKGAEKKLARAGFKVESNHHGTPKHKTPELAAPRTVD